MRYLIYFNTYKTTCDSLHSHLDIVSVSYIWWIFYLCIYVFLCIYFFTNLFLNGTFRHDCICFLFRNYLLLQMFELNLSLIMQARALYLHLPIICLYFNLPAIVLGQQNSIHICWRHWIMLWQLVFDFSLPGPCWTFLETVNHF